MLLLPQSEIRPSYQNGFARRAGESAEPGLWRSSQVGFVPALGITGNRLVDVVRGVIATPVTTMPGWVVSGGVRAIRFNDNIAERTNFTRSFAANSKICIVMHIRADTTYGASEASSYVGTDGSFEATIWQKADRYFEFILNSFSTNDRVNTGYALSDNTHYTIAGQYNGSALTIWVDGKQVNSVTPTGTWAGATDWHLGAFNNQTTWECKGDLKSLWMFDRALSAQEHQQLHRDLFAPLRLAPLSIPYVEESPAGGNVNLLRGKFPGLLSGKL